MKVLTRREGEVLIVQPRGRIEGAMNAKALHEAFENALKPADRALVLDLEELSYMSSAGLRAIAIMSNHARVAKVSFVVCSLSTSMVNLFATSGFDQLVRVVDTLEDARFAVAG